MPHNLFFLLITETEWRILHAIDLTLRTSWNIVCFQTK